MKLCDPGELQRRRDHAMVPEPGPAPVLLRGRNMQPSRSFLRLPRAGFWDLREVLRDKVWHQHPEPKAAAAGRGPHLRSPQLSHPEICQQVGEGSANKNVMNLYCKPAYWKCRSGTDLLGSMMIRIRNLGNNVWVRFGPDNWWKCGLFKKKYQDYETGLPLGYAPVNLYSLLTAQSAPMFKVSIDVDQKLGSSTTHLTMCRKRIRNWEVVLLHI